MKAYGTALPNYLVHRALIRTWIAARAAGVPVSFMEALGMKLRRSPVADILEAQINGFAGGVRWSMDVVEAHALAGGSPGDVIGAAVTLRAANVTVDRNVLLAVDLYGVAVKDLADAFVKRRAQLAHVRFTEVLERAVEGEDVLGAVTGGTFVPRLEAGAWRARLEFGPLTAPELRDLLDNDNLPDATTVWDPQAEAWMSVAQARARLDAS